MRVRLIRLLGGVLVLWWWDVGEGVRGLALLSSSSGATGHRCTACKAILIDAVDIFLDFLAIILEARGMWAKAFVKL